MTDEKMKSYMSQAKELRDERTKLSSEIDVLSQKRYRLTRKINRLESIVNRAIKNESKKFESQ